MAKSVVDEEVGFPIAGEFIVQLKERFAKISAYHDKLKKKATPAMARVHRSYHRTAIIGMLANLVAVLLEEDARLLALILGFFLSYVCSALWGLCPLHRPVRDGVIMEQEFLNDLKVLRDSERARLDLDKMETLELEMLKFTPDFAELTSCGYLMIFSAVLSAVFSFMVAAIPVFF